MFKILLCQFLKYFLHFKAIIHLKKSFCIQNQKEMVDNIEENIEETQINVDKGARYIQQASKYKVAAYPIAGAMIGTCIGGPIGLLAGIKIGGLAALSCGILGKSYNMQTYQSE